MATLNDLLNNFGLSDDDADVGHQKVASETQDATDDEQALLENLLGSGTEKVASEGGGQMGSLAELYMNLTEHDDEVGSDDLDKIAELAAEDSIQDEAGVEKLAAEYDAAGRIMARGFYDELNKLARELEDPTQAATPALGDRGTQYQMETNYEDKGKLVTQGGEKQHANILKGQADGPAGRAEGAMGPQFATAKHLVTSRAGQAGAQ